MDSENSVYAQVCLLSLYQAIPCMRRFVYNPFTQLSQFDI